MSVQKKWISKEAIIILVLLVLIFGCVFYVLSLSDTVGLKVVAQVELANSYMKKVDSLYSINESMRNAAIETLHLRDLENKELKKELHKIENELLKKADSLMLRLDVKNKLIKEKDAKIDSLNTIVVDLRNLKRSTIEQQYKN